VDVSVKQQIDLHGISQISSVHWLLVQQFQPVDEVEMGERNQLLAE